MLLCSESICDKYFLIVINVSCVARKPVFGGSDQVRHKLGAEVIKLFSCSTQLSMKFKMLLNIEIAKINGIFRFNLLEPAIYPAYKC